MSETPSEPAPQYALVQSTSDAQGNVNTEVMRTLPSGADPGPVFAAFDSAEPEEREPGDG